MDVDESSSSSSETPNSSYGNPQFIENGETIYGLDVDSKKLPPLESLLGRYSWVETGLESPCGPQLDQGMTLQLKDPADGPGGVQGEFTFLGEAGVITAVRRCNPEQGDLHPSWQGDVTWSVSDENKARGFPTRVHIYVGIVLDDNHAPFLEVVFRAELDVRRPYGYAKRQADEGEAVGLSDAEKERPNFLTIADYGTMMDIKEDEQRKLMDNQLLKERLEEEERQKQEMERRKKLAEQSRKQNQEHNARVAAERMQRQEPGQEPREHHDGMTNKQRKAAQKKRIHDERQAEQLAANKANGVLTKRERKRLEQEKRAAENSLRPETSPRTKKQRKAEQERLAREEAKHDLLKNPPHIAASASSIQTSHSAPILSPKREESVAMGPRGISNAAVKHEEVLLTLDQRGIKRTHPDDPSNDSKKRIKLEY